MVIKAGLLTCQRVRDDGVRQVLGDAYADEFSVYSGYDCLTFDDHVERHGYGPHEFKVTDRGVAEIQNDRYRALHPSIGLAVINSGKSPNYPLQPTSGAGGLWLIEGTVGAARG